MNLSIFHSPSAVVFFVSLCILVTHTSSANCIGALQYNQDLPTPNGCDYIGDVFRFGIDTENGDLYFDSPLERTIFANGGVGAILTMQGDGNLVLYRSDGSPAWDSQTVGNHGAILVMDDRQGAARILALTGELLAAFRPGPCVGPILQPGGVLYPNEFLCYSTTRFGLSADGDVICSNNGVISQVSGQSGPASSLVIQASDGNLVAYGPGMNAVWASGTVGNAVSAVYLINDAVAQIIGSGGAVIETVYCGPPSPISAPNPSPPSPIQSPERIIALREFFESEVLGEDEDETSVPFELAVNWITNDDPMQLSVGAPNLLRRFLLAFLNYHWRLGTCDSADGVCDDPLDNFWLTGSDECDWGGISCSGGVLVEINLRNRDLSGNLPTEIGLLETLGALSLGSNGLDGSIPSQIGLILNLGILELNGNNLEGQLPDTFANLSLLSYVDLSKNTISGELPNFIGSLTSLGALLLGDNDFIGAIPIELGFLTRLTSLFLEDNRFTGTIPTELYSLGHGLVSTLALILSGNNLTGTLSTEIGLSPARLILLNRNELEGKIPSEIANAPNLSSFQVGLNMLTGSVPLELCDEIEEIIADCAPINSPLVQCACCSVCCDREADTCEIA